jgi:phenylpyruvate tautomerase PptA (4-oxalocrotonate tautomerase family)
MPLITLTVRKPKTAEFKSAVLDSVHEALKTIGVPPTDLFQRVLELDEEDFRFHPTYPDATKPRTNEFVLIEILLSVGRSVKVKKEFLANLKSQIESKHLEMENVMVVFKETTWENWAFAGGRQVHV